MGLSTVLYIHTYTFSFIASGKFYKCAHLKSPYQCMKRSTVSKEYGGKQS